MARLLPVSHYTRPSLKKKNFVCAHENTKKSIYFAKKKNGFLKISANNHYRPKINIHRLTRYIVVKKKPAHNHSGKARIIDIAERAKVSPGTVDRVIHDRGEVSKKTREKVLRIIREMDYQPDVVASVLASKKSFRIAVLIPRADTSSRFWESPATGMNDALNEIGHFGIRLDHYLFDYFDRSGFVRQAQQVIQSKPDGVVVAPVFSEETGHFAGETIRHSIPLVFINACIAHQPHLAFVGQDAQRSGMVAAKLMYFGLGDKPVLIVNFIHKKGNQAHILEREEGFRKHYISTNTKADTLLHSLQIDSASQTLTNNILGETLKNRPDIQGIFVTNSRVHRVAAFLEMINRTDIRLIGYDITKENKAFLARDTIDFLIGQQPWEQGYKSVMALFNHLVLKKEPKKTQHLPIDIITRENIEDYHSNESIAT